MGNPAETYIYALIDPRDQRVRYVGKANDVVARLGSHLRDCRRRNSPVHSWLISLTSLGLFPQIQILCSVPYSEWCVAERDWIFIYRSIYSDLLNLADGGDEPLCSQNQRVLNGRIAARSRVSTPFKARVNYLKQQIGMLLRHGVVSEEVKNKLRYAAARRPDLFGLWASI